ncbi:MAG TPA: hypothetical protein VJM14_15535 [Burkholderiales bacterium]|nr:hypothetical protein [Burkholderiales bacterium]
MPVEFRYPLTVGDTVRLELTLRRGKARTGCETAAAPVAQKLETRQSRATRAVGPARSHDVATDRCQSKLST